MENLHIIKIGGNILDDDKKLQMFLRNLVKIPERKILVHGGGKLASALSSRLGIEPVMHNGRRITDAETLKIVTMVYAGWLNKSIVAALNSLGAASVGLCGADAKLIPSVKRPVGEVDFGFAGDVIYEEVNDRLINDLLCGGLLPVVASITADASGQLLNTNADTIAAALAAALAVRYSVRLIYCFEKKGVLLDVSNDDSVLNDLDRNRYEELKSKGVIDRGMIPKLDNAFNALAKGVHRVLIGDADDILLLTSQKKHEGTLIRN
ncbi:MAG TPA: acetylglutamate kinase [Chitinophagales bacterium]|nr:acetylglutamate kinase [Chitinophagales bacterium]